MEITKELIQRNFDIGRSQGDICFIVLHTFDGPGSDLHDWFNRVENNPDKRSSAHFSVQFDGSVKQYIETENVAYHVGHPWMNARSIGIEHQDNGDPMDSVRTEALYESSASLVADLIEKYPTIPCRRDFILSHREAFFRGWGYWPSFTCCAGLNVDRIVNRAKEILDIRKNEMSQIQDLTIQVESLKNDNANLNNEISKLKTESETYKTQLENVNLSNRALSDENLSLKVKNDTLGRQVEELESKVKGLEPGDNYLAKIIADFFRKIFNR